MSVRDYLPLQQGLRPLSLLQTRQRREVRDYLPLQQGLRQGLTAVAVIDFFVVRDYLPLQQGLRP